MSTLLQFAWAFLTACSLAVLAGCAGAPVQEMSDARQAIRAAADAGAEQHAVAQITEARQLVKSAEGDIYVGDFRQARERARLAREKAIEARSIAETVARSP